MVSIASHFVMLDDRKRTRAYRNAIRKVVRPGDTVLDLGCGTGILGLFALQAGAKRVHAVDRHPILYVAEKFYRENGFGDRVTIHHSDIRDLKLGKRVDVIVAELIGHASINENLIGLHKAALRFLRRGGRVVPREAGIVLAPVSAPSEHRVNVSLSGLAGLGLKTSTLQGLARHRPILSRKIREIARPKTACRIRLDRPGIPAEPLVLRARFRPRGTMHGVALWNDIDLAPGARLDARRGTHWIPLVLPLPEPVRLRGETVSVEVTLHRDEACTWIVRTPRGTFVQDSDLGEESAPASMALDPRAVPSLPPDLRKLAPVLESVDGRRTLEQIARTVARKDGLPMNRAMALVKEACLGFKMAWRDGK